MDVFDFCNATLQQKLKVNREAADKEFAEKMKSKREEYEDKMDVENTTGTELSKPPSQPEMEIDEEEELKKAMALSMGTISSESSEPIFGNGLPDNFTGKYELYALVTHKGRSADSGHYIGWVRQDSGSDYWWKYDDDKVTEVKTENILLLSGGGDRDMAYLIFYRFLNC